MPLSQVLTLTNRDLSILVFTWSFGGVTADLICKRHFHAGPGALRACYRRIARLIGQGLLTCTRLPSSTSVGSGKAFPTLGKAARPILTEALGFSSSAELGRIRMAAPRYLAHHLATAEFRLELTIACERSAVFELLDWTPELELEREPICVKDPKTIKNLVLIADGAFELSLQDGGQQRFLVEIDMGTVTSKRLRGKLRGYVISNAGAVVLFVVPDAKREQTIASWAQEEAQALHSAADIFWVTTMARVRAASLTSSPIWTVASRAASPQSLLDMVGAATDGDDKAPTANLELEHSLELERNVYHPSPERLH
jgi:hypothetical protein